MTIFKHILIHIKRHPVKVLLQFALVFLLSTLASSAISIRQAIINTDQNLRRQLPAIAMIRQDVEAHTLAGELTGEWITIEGVHASVVREIGILPYVRMFDYTAWGFQFFSTDLVRVFYPELIEDVVLTDQHSLLAQGVGFEQFNLKGIHNPYVADIEAGLIDLVTGRVFTALEVENGDHVALVSQNFLLINNLQLGDTLLLEYKIYREEAGTLIIEQHFAEDNLLGSKIFELEIIGVFEHTFEENPDQNVMEISNHFEIINRFYVPNKLIESTIELYVEVLSEEYPEFLEEFLGAESVEDFIQYENMVFLLYDPIYLSSFRYAAERILPEFWVISDLSNAYATISSSMEMMNEIADGLLIGASLAIMITLSLLLIIFLRDRQLEIGIYLALGKKKINIAFQVIIEILIIAFIAITCSLFVGNILASEISIAMIQHDLERQEAEGTSISILGESLESMGFRFEITPEEMLEAYDVSLSVEVIITFYSLTISVIVSSALIPVVYIMKSKPKDILLKSSIG